MRRGVVWVAVKLSRVCLFVGGIGALGLVVAVASAIFGEDRFPAPFEGESAGIGTYAWQVGVMIVGAWLVWGALSAIVARLGQLDDLARMSGAGDWVYETHPASATPAAAAADDSGWLAPETPRRSERP